jgi:serine/threonine-protein kinase
MTSRIIKIAALFSIFVLVVAISAYLTLTLIIKSEDTVVVPDLVGKDVVYVLELLTDLGLNTKVKGSEYSKEFSKNHIIFQEPEPGAEIKKGRDIKIILSKGARSILMPNLKGLSLQQARIILEENSLCQEKVSITYSDNIKKDEIIAQAPSTGSMINRGGCVTLLVSLGVRPPAYKMPNLKVFSLDSAIPLMESGNLALGELRSSFNKDEPLNIIIDQEPQSGHRVIEGGIVSLVINRKPGEKEQGFFRDINGLDLFRYRLKSGFLKRHIRVSLNNNGVSDDLFDGLMKPGEEIWLLVPKDTDATLFLYENGELAMINDFYDKW